MRRPQSISQNVWDALDYHSYSWLPIIDTVDDILTFLPTDILEAAFEKQAMSEISEIETKIDLQCSLAICTGRDLPK